MGAGAISGGASLWRPATCRPGVKDPVDLFVTHFQRPSLRDIPPRYRVNMIYCVCCMPWFCSYRIGFSADKVQKKAQIFQCNPCRFFFGQGPQVRGHILDHHVATDQAPYHCVACKFRGEVLAVLEKHAATPRHGARAIMLSEDQRASALVRGDWVFFAGPNGDATPWGRGLSTRFWWSGGWGGVGCQRWTYGWIGFV